MSYTIEDVKEFKKNILKPTDTFQFKCKMCGDCCRKRDTPIMLTGFDLFRIAQALKMPPAQVIEEKTIGYIGDQSHVPILTLKERLDGSCSLLRKGKCTVQENKPVVCAIFPLGRIYNPLTNEMEYFNQALSCQRDIQDNKTWTLQEWLDAFHIPELEKESMTWNSLLMGVGQVTCQIPREQLPEEMIAAMGNCFYIRYDITKPYIPQAEENMLLLKLYFKKKFNKEINFDI